MAIVRRGFDLTGVCLRRGKVDINGFVGDLGGVVSRELTLTTWGWWDGFVMYYPC
jgi:hypothetical protein